MNNLDYVHQCPECEACSCQLDELRDRVKVLEAALREIADDGCARAITIREEGGTRALRCAERRPTPDRSGWCACCRARAALAEVGK